MMAWVSLFLAVLAPVGWIVAAFRTERIHELSNMHRELCDMNDRLRDELRALKTTGTVAKPKSAREAREGF